MTTIPFTREDILIRTTDDMLHAYKVYKDAPGLPYVLECVREVKDAFLAVIDAQERDEPIDADRTSDALTELQRAKLYVEYKDCNPFGWDAFGDRLNEHTAWQEEQGHMPKRKTIPVYG